MNIQMISTFPEVGDLQEEKIQSFVSLGWVITGSREYPETPNPRKGIMVMVTLQWPEHLGEPVLPK